MAIDPSSLDRSDEPERRGGQPQLVGGQPAQALPVADEPDGARARHQSLPPGGRQLVQGTHGDPSAAVTTKSGCSRRIASDSSLPSAIADNQRLVGDPVRGGVGVLVDGDHRRAEAPQGDRQLPAGLAGPQQHHPGRDVAPLVRDLRGLVLSFGPAVSHRSRIGRFRTASRLAGKQPHHQAVTLGQHRLVAVDQLGGDERLAALGAGDAAAHRPTAHRSG